MQKPKGYDEVQAYGERELIEVGGHHMVIMGAEEAKTRSGKEMLKVYLDTATSDRQPMLFMNRYRNAPEPDDGTKKKWPYDGTSYLVTEDDKGNCTSRLKGFITSVEASNPGASCPWGDGLCAWLKGKRVGAVYGIQMDAYQGKPVERHQLRWFCADDKVDEAKVPNQTETEEYRLLNGGALSVPDPDFMNVGDTLGDELPFM